MPSLDESFKAALVAIKKPKKLRIEIEGKEYFPEEIPSEVIPSFQPTKQHKF